MLRRVLLVAIIVAAFWLVVTHAQDVAKLLTTARGGSWQWLAAAVVLQIGYYACYVLTYRQSFASAGVRRSYLELVPVIFASVFVATVVPSGGAAGPGLVVDDSVRRGHPLAQSAAGALVAQFTDFAGFAVVMAVGFGYLATIGRITLLEVIAAAVFVLLVVGLGSILVFAQTRPAWLSAVLVWLQSTETSLRRLVHLEPRAPWAEHLGEELGASLRVVGGNRPLVWSAWSVAVAGHVLDLACFIAVGFAFGWHGTGALLAGYAVGIVVWLVSLVPQGVGVVEGAVALLLTSLGVPAATATAISLTFRGMTFWLPFAVGFSVLPRVATFSRPGPGSRGRLAARASAVFVFVVGVINILSAATPSLQARLMALESVLPFQVTYGHLSAALAGVALLMLSRGLWYHKRAAYILTVALLAISATSHMLKGLDYEEATVAIAAMLFLIANRPTFYAKADQPSVRQGIRVLLGAFIIVLAYGTAGFWLLDRQFSVNFGMRAALRQTVAMFVEFYNPGLQPITGFGRYFAYSIYLVGGVTFGFALVMLLRPVLLRHPASAADHRRAEKIVRRWGSTAIAPLALLPDKAYWFSEGGSVIAFALAGEIAVTLGDPVGPPEDAEAAASGFISHALSNGWRAVFYEIHDPERYRALGYSVTHLGDEAIVDLKEFSLAGKSHKSLRNKMRHLQDEGYVATVTPPPISARLMAELRDVSDAWLAMSKGSEKRFALGWFDEDYLRQCPMMIVRDRVGEAVAFANVLDEHRVNEVTIDLMRHRSEAPSGTMDFLFLSLFEWSREQGYDTFNLGVSPLAGVGDEPTDPAAEKVLRLVYEYGNAFYGFKGLHAYKDKFDPCWEPRYLAYPDPAMLPAAFAASARVNSGENPVKGYLKSLRQRENRPKDASATNA